MSVLVFPLLLLSAAVPGGGLYCHHAKDHRHVGTPARLVLGQHLQQGRTSSPVSSARKEETAAEERNAGNRSRTSEEDAVLSGSCPTGCRCHLRTDQVRVECGGRFSRHFPVDMLRRDTAVLAIVPRSGRNQLTLGPSFALLAGLKQLTIANSGIPNIGQRTLWGLSGEQ